MLLHSSGFYPLLCRRFSVFVSQGPEYIGLWILPLIGRLAAYALMSAYGLFSLKQCLMTTDMQPNYYRQPLVFRCVLSVLELALSALLRMLRREKGD